jgi:hypothetical protein
VIGRNKDNFDWFGIGSRVTSYMLVVAGVGAALRQCDVMYEAESQTGGVWARRRLGASCCVRRD